MSEHKDQQEVPSGTTRRQLFEGLGKGAAYVAPATLVLLSGKANAAS